MLNVRNTVPLPQKALKTIFPTRLCVDLFLFMFHIFNIELPSLFPEIYFCGFVWGFGLILFEVRS